ncbi:hypothetical protein Psta_3814 [Pirellula staleyi DSM 6068]|uniref:DUF3500 domain-containing protein n=1 Tax=Pirellula staleyi (strain ATCC 27377 / DSM 6068 / ICPB 4128) TaxID=530564 RepID=D2R0Y4_PIRSD|nr:DUF3500 domain-containing protein [Pirellula staleyi]ADB18469.1 hypothetical protein Psta_3814 [Pirellula staleyi DSM 6068]
MTSENQPGSKKDCPDCESSLYLPRRDFIRVVGSAAVASALAPAAKLWGADEKPAADKTPESIVKHLYDSLNEKQRKDVCFDWDYQDPKRGLLRTRISNNWHITSPVIKSDYFTSDQQQMIRDIFEGMIQPEWHAKFDKQLQDDAGGFGNSQNIAIFGKPGEGKYEFVMTGRHMTLRCDGNTADHVAFGGPIFYGHAANGFNESADHKGNVFWEQALAANEVYKMLDGKQRKLAEVADTPREQESGMQGPEGKFPGIPVADMSSDQKELVQKTLLKLIEPYRQTDRDEVLSCLKAQGGIDKCSLAFYVLNDLGGDKVWDNWRLEGPNFVWYFRGEPHVHVWVNIADNHKVELNA